MKTSYFARNSIPVHVNTFEHGWFNGWITKLTDDFVSIDEYVKGNKDIFLVDIKDIVAFEPNNQKEENKDGRKN